MLHISDLHRQADSRLEEAPGNHKKLILIHTALALGVSLLLTVATYLFSLEIANTGGLGGLGLRSLLSTAQTVLELAVAVALPFWQISIFYVALQWINREKTAFSDLFQSFRRFGATLGFLFLRGGIFIALGITVFYISTAVFMLTSYATPVLEFFLPIMEQGTTPEQLEALLTPEILNTLTTASIPLLIIFAVLYGVIAIPVFYRLRFANFALMEGLPAGRALLKSLAITRKHCRQIFRLDLSFWWFYLLQMLSVVICYTDTILPVFGITLPVSGVGVAFGFYVLGCICQCILLWQKEAHRLTTFALAYRTLDGTLDTETPSEQV